MSLGTFFWQVRASSAAAASELLSCLLQHADFVNSGCSATRRKFLSATQQKRHRWAPKATQDRDNGQLPQSPTKTFVCNLQLCFAVDVSRNTAWKQHCTRRSVGCCSRSREKTVQNEMLIRNRFVIWPGHLLCSHNKATTMQCHLTLVCTTRKKKQDGSQHTEKLFFLFRLHFWVGNKTHSRTHTRNS